MNGRDARGFTLIEVVVALSLLAVILTGLLSALVTFANSASRVDERILAGDDARLIQVFLRQSLGEASPQLRQRPEDSALVSGLRGTSTELEWLGLMPARHGIGGLYHLWLGVGDEGDLVLRYLPYVGDRAPDWRAARTHVLLPGPSRLDLAYQPLDEREWRANWLDAQVLPARVRIALAREDEVWPALVVPLLAAEPLVGVNRSKGAEDHR